MRLCIILATVGVLVGCQGPMSPSRGTPLAPLASSQGVDVLDYLLGQDGTRHGTQYQQQISSPGRVCWVKYAQPDEFECWRWDDQWVYHDVDHAIDGKPRWSYRFSDGRWLPRRLAVNMSGDVQPWALDVTSNVETFYSPSCEATRGVYGGMPDGSFPYRVSVSGVAGEMVLEYAPHAPGMAPESAERFSFKRGVGWYRWEGRGSIALFDQPGGPVVQRGTECP